MAFGVIGCGVISTAYLKAAQRFANLELRAVADMRSAAAEKQGAEFGVPAMRVDQLLKRDDVEIVVNLTVPLAHTDVSLAVLNAGKHVHSEKPLGVNVAEARKVMDLAAAKDLRVGCAPDTFLGGGHQTARKADRRRRDRHAGRRHAPSSCAPATSAGIRRPASTICAAAGRCSTWAPTTSPTWSSCSAPSPASWARSPSRGSSAWSPASR